MSDRFSKHRLVSQSNPYICDLSLRTGNFSIILPLVSDHLGDHAICWTKDSKHAFIFTI